MRRFRVKSPFVRERFWNIARDGAVAAHEQQEAYAEQSRHAVERMPHSIFVATTLGDQKDDEEDTIQQQQQAPSLDVHTNY